MTIVEVFTSAFDNPSLVDDFLIILLVCSLKLSFKSNVTPRSLISFTREILIFFNF